MLSEVSHRWIFYDQRKSGNEPSMTHRWTFYEVSMIHRWGSLGTQPGRTKTAKLVKFRANHMLTFQRKSRKLIKTYQFIKPRKDYQNVSFAKIDTNLVAYTTADTHSLLAAGVHKFAV